MEHRKFLQRLDELVAELTHAQAQKVIAALQQRGDGDEVQRILDQRLEDDPKCPHCGSRRIEGWGRERNGLPRSRCLMRMSQTSLEIENKNVKNSNISAANTKSVGRITLANPIRDIAAIARNSAPTLLPSPLSAVSNI